MNEFTYHLSTPSLTAPEGQVAAGVAVVLVLTGLVVAGAAIIGHRASGA
ncbi:hypothetical protein [Galactobacter valiniphilus]|nr:hypothetical protein [Galactobacter valiniphilus]